MVRGGGGLDGRETVLVRGRSGVRLVSLGELWAEAMPVPNTSHRGIEPRHLRGLEVQVWQPGTSRPGFVQLEGVVRRRFAGEVLELRTKMGRRIRCAPDQPMVVGDPASGDWEQLIAAMLGDGNWLPVAGEFGASAAPPAALDVLAGIGHAGLCESEVILRPAPGALARFSAADLHARLRGLAPRRGRERSYDILRCEALRLPEARALGIPLDGGSVSSVTNGTYVPLRIPVDEAFWRVVGLYLAEGHSARDGLRRRLSWAFHPTKEGALVEEVANYWRRLGVKAHVRRLSTTTAVVVSSRLLAGFWVEYLGLGADCYSHRVPDVIWSCPEGHKRALLSGLWHGDGSWSRVCGGPSVVLEYGTVSPGLADGMLRLLGDLGIVARQKVARTAKSTVDTYWLVIAGADQVERVLELAKPECHETIRSSIGR